MLIRGNCIRCHEYGNLQPDRSFRKGVCEMCIDKEEREKIKKEEILEKSRMEVVLKDLAPALSFLDKDNYFEADWFVLGKQSSELLKEYEKIKLKFVKADLLNLERKIGEKEGYFDDEKATVLSATGKNILVQARAGSGKTTVVALRVRQLIKYYKAKPNEILVLAFNNKAADEFRDRIEKYCGKGFATKSNTLTFHALARRIANSNKNLLDGEKIIGTENDCRGQDKKLQIDFMQECFNNVEERENGIIEKLFYYFLKTVSEKMRGAFRDDKDYYFYLRNLQQTTIAGEFVKSKGEKYIADFLFEHRISKNGKELEYVYEHNIKDFIKSARAYSPDFSLFFSDDEKKEKLQAVIEYFGFTEKNKGFPGFFETEKEAQDYLDEAKNKRQLFQGKKIAFIEISQDHFDQIAVNNFRDEESERFEFENIIRRKLIKLGFDISENRLGIKEILSKIPRMERRKKKLVFQITQFINKAQKLSYDPDKIREKAEIEKKNGDLSSRNEYFLKIVSRVYREYCDQLIKQSCTDFDGLFVDAINKIKNEGGKCKIVSKYGEVEIANIKYILIDEYQDFSELFYRLIDEIRNVSLPVSLFCVGDDWQAINGFAGSDLEYFENFERKYFIGGRRISLLTNYRSGGDIVRHANLLMDGRGPSGEPEKNKSNGAIYLSKLLRVELRSNQDYIKEFNNDKKYRLAARSLVGLQDKAKKTPLEISRYLKTVEAIARNIGNKDICLLFRTNSLYGVEISRFTKVILTWCPQQHIICSTVHSFKGKEKEVVIVVDANRKKFPKIHPDNELMDLLGVNMLKVLEEERRLFYVAITRAKEELYLLYDEEIGYSDFISPERWRYLQI
ncbi:MAG: hypothetical protein UR78_C0001G0020 [Candidatus Moranbacteria bacterium GW2011_GWF2_35_39]|nr:MAG: hypothetical protein UR78_C0001G0020 [Candidatus Moranbacteria bacterium GW2011_GWF2_35_39]